VKIIAHENNKKEQETALAGGRRAARGSVADAGDDAHAGVADG
jgi:hypothetical protein